MQYENLIVEKRGRVAIVTVNRPDKLNALNLRTRRELLAAFENLEKDGEIRVVVIRGAGEKAFIAGADIGEFAGYGLSFFRSPFRCESNQPTICL